MAMIDMNRYARQMMLPEVGPEGQKRLMQRAVLVVGAGGLGAPILQYLVASGVGRIAVVDRDCLEETNLNRQVLYIEEELGGYKAELACSRLSRLNAACTLSAHPIALDETNALDLARPCDLIIDATDNLATRYLLDTTAERLGIPYLYGAVEGFVGQTSLFHYAGVAGYRALFPEYDSQQDSRPVGILGATAGVLGSIMATEVIKVLLGLPSSLAGKLLRFDLRTMDFVCLDLPK